MQRQQLDAFKKWCDDQDIAHREGRGDYEALQVFYDNGWRRIWSNGSNDKLTMEKHIAHLEAICFKPAQQATLF